MIERRKFLGISAAAAVVVAVPVVSFAAQKSRPEIGTEFYSCIYLNSKEYEEVGFDDCNQAFHRIEVDRGVCLGNYFYSYNYNSDIATVVIKARAEVIGYI